MKMRNIVTNKTCIVCGWAEPSYKIPKDIKAADWKNITLSAWKISLGGDRSIACKLNLINRIMSWTNKMNI